MKEGTVFNRMKGKDKEWEEFPNVELYFSKQISIKSSDLKPKPSFDIVYLGLKDIVRPVYEEELALHQFLANLTHRTYSNFEKDQIEKAQSLFGEKVRWARVIHRIEMQLRRMLSRVEMEDEVEDLTNAEFAEWAY